MSHLPAIFQNEHQAYVADTCEELKGASSNREVKLRAWSHPPYPGREVSKDYIPEIRSLGFWDAHQQQSWGLAPHCNEGIELSFVAGGQVDFGVGDEHWIMKSSQIAITRPWQFHQIGSPHVTPSRLFWLILDVNVRRPNQRWRWPDWLILSRQELNQLTELLSHNEQPVWDTNPEILQIFNELFHLLETSRPEESETKVKLFVNELLLALLQLLLSKGISVNRHLSSSERVVSMFLEALQQHLSYPWSLAVMSQQCGLSRSQFSNYCKCLTNMTPIQYLNECRHKAALELFLEQPDLTIGEIAAACGFNSLQYFSTCFQHRHGCSPKEYRENPPK